MSVDDFVQLYRGLVSEERALLDRFVASSDPADLVLWAEKDRYMPSSIDDWLTEVAVIKPEWFGNGERFRVPGAARHLGHRGGGRFFFVMDMVADPIVWQMVKGSQPGTGCRRRGRAILELSRWSVGS